MGRRRVTETIPETVSRLRKARETIKRARRELGQVHARITSHEYLEGLSSRIFERNKLGLFPKAQGHIIESDLRSVALALGRARSRRSREFFLQMLEGERDALRELAKLGRALGVDPRSLTAEDPLPGAFAYSAFVAWLASQGSPAEFAGAFLVNLPTWGENCAAMREALRDAYGISLEALAFFDLFARPAPAFEAAGLEVLAEELGKGGNPALVIRAARLLQAYELLFWDSLAAASKG